MRFFTRLFIFWLIAAPLFWFFGMPRLLDYLTTKAQAENDIACRQQLHTQGIVPRQVSEETGIRYCYCLNQALQFGREDLFEMMKTRKISTRMQTELTAQIELCTPMLDARSVQVPMPKAPIRHNDGSLEYQF